MTGRQSIAAACTPTAPAAPDALTAAWLGPDSCELDWHDKNGNETAFTLARSTDDAFAAAGSAVKRERFQMQGMTLPPQTGR